MFSHFCGHKYSGIKCSFAKAAKFSLAISFFCFFYQYLHSDLEAGRAEVNRRSTPFCSMRASWNCCVGCASNKYDKNPRPSDYRRGFFGVSIFKLIDRATLFCLTQAEESVLLLSLFQLKESESSADRRTFSASIDQTN